MTKKEEMLQELSNNPNNMSYWLPKLREHFPTPETIIIPIPIYWFDWLISDDYKPEKIKEFSAWIVSEIKARDFDTSTEMFMKTGNFSNKFCFSQCHLKNLDNIGQQFLDIFNASMCFGITPSPEIVLRRFMHTNYDQPTIYNGLKLNFEFRAFCEFDSEQPINNKFLDVFNHWDTETMLKNLYDKNDIEAFKSCMYDIEANFLLSKEFVTEVIKEKIKHVKGLSGIWSLDFLWDGEELWLIDAGIGAQCYFYDKLNLE